MPEEPSKISIWVARIAVAALVVLGVYGSVKYGFSAEVRQRFWHDLAERPGGPMTFRFILQPIIASIAAIHAGIQDARVGRPGFLWSILHDPDRRKRRLREALTATGQIILLGIVMDTIYQIQVLKTFYPAEAYHQDYFKNNAYQPYCQVVVAPKVAKARKSFVSKLKK